MDKLYFVAVVAPPSLDREVRSLKETLLRKYGTKSALKAPAHITLFAPFYFPMEREKELVAAISGIKMDETRIVLSGFDSFPPRTIFIRVMDNEKLEMTWKEVNAAMTRIPGIIDKGKRTDFHPHMTIGNRDWIDGSFQLAWKEFKDAEFNREFLTREISLLRLDDGKWKMI